ncbi:hypothetical protein PR048_026899 [Dryococelus australis]|uniref:Protein Wnt n=1 Tax=Dryococelus australis TaxID=614101 RepID=A0ABQ9GMM7_9NEOP|nr:hypothetical protein PR048_026899 [Dryococelus australis]
MDAGERWGVVALGAHTVCARIPGLTARQRDMCRAAPDAMVATGDGVRLALHECHFQFRHRRWNCSAIGSHHAFGHVVIVGESLIPASAPDKRSQVLLFPVGLFQICLQSIHDWDRLIENQHL